MFGLSPYIPTDLRFVLRPFPRHHTGLLHEFFFRLIPMAKLFLPPKRSRSGIIFDPHFLCQAVPSLFFFGHLSDQVVQKSLALFSSLDR